MGVVDINQFIVGRVSMGKENLEKVRNQISIFYGFEKVGNWPTKSGRVGKRVKKSRKCREFHIFKGVENKYLNLLKQKVGYFDI